MESKTLQEQLKTVAAFRTAIEEQKALKEESYTEWRLKNAGLLATIERNIICLQEAESLLRQTALEGYAKDQNKAPVPGVTIKIFEKLEYDTGKAYDWAVEHRVALKLDSKMFESVVKTAPALVPFVTITEEPRCQISQDLSKIILDNQSS